ncbi:hypothetical protein ACA910_001090 [Epithemia clementina (nom. ined.)]
MASSPPKFNFPGPVGTKRRRMRSGGNVSTITNNNAPSISPPVFDRDSLAEEDVVTLAEADDVGEKVVQTSKCKGATTIPIFLKKTYKMIDTCDPTIASWTEEGDMFVVKDPEIFATRVIPQYFDHNKFSSFARQLNFYGFRKMQSKPIRNSDFDASSAKHVTFFNENFKRGRCDLLKKIQRSTRGTGATTGQDQAREIQTLRDQVSNLENKIQEMSVSTEERFRRLELDMLARIEQVMMAMQQQQAQLRLQAAASIGSASSNANNSNNNNNNNGMGNVSTGTVSTGGQQRQQSWDMNANVSRNNSINTGMQGNSLQGNGMLGNKNSNPPLQMDFPMQPQRQPMMHAASGGSGPGGSIGGGPTLPPHPKQKQLPMGGLPQVMRPPMDRLNSLRGISGLSRGLSGIPRGASVESSASAVLMRSSWEDKFFSMLMLDENGQNIGGVTPTTIGNNTNDGSMMAPAPLPNSGAAGGMLSNAIPPMVSEPSLDGNSGGNKQRNEQQSLLSGNEQTMPGPDDLSSVSSSDIP